MKKEGDNIVCIAGLGLIGGSLALALKKCGFAKKIVGVDNSILNAKTALSMGLADEILPLEEGLKQSDIIILCTPVHIIKDLLPTVLDQISGSSKVVTDMGSTKWQIVQSVKTHTSRGRYVAFHPIAGTEFSGPTAAQETLFADKNAIICDRERSDDDALRTVKNMAKMLKMNISYMNSRNHDLHAAYVSHISHITSFSLALSVLDKEKKEENILTLAASGFESTVRLAKSNAKTWSPIFLQNSEFITEVIDSYLEKMNLFRQYISEQNEEGLCNLMNEANEIKKILKT